MKNLRHLRWMVPLNSSKLTEVSNGKSNTWMLTLGVASGIRVAHVGCLRDRTRNCDRLPSKARSSGSRKDLAFNPSAQHLVIVMAPNSLPPYAVDIFHFQLPQSSLRWVGGVNDDRSTVKLVHALLKQIWGQLVQS